MQLLSENGGENETMNLKNSLVSLILITIIASVTFAVAVTVSEWYHPHTVTVTKIVLEEYLEGTLIANGTTIDWGTQEAGATYLLNYTVKCIGRPCTVRLVVTGLPAGWSLTWAKNNTALMTGAYAEADLTLTIPASAEGAYSWSTILRGI